jgi:hypothetical protein
MLSTTFTVDVKFIDSRCAGVQLKKAAPKGRYVVLEADWPFTDRPVPSHRCHQ